MRFVLIHAINVIFDYGVSAKLIVQAAWITLFHPAGHRRSLKLFREVLNGLICSRSADSMFGW